MKNIQDHRLDGKEIEGIIADSRVPAQNFIWQALSRDGENAYNNRFL